MDTALTLLKALGNIFSALKVAGGGPVYWVAAGVMIILTFWLGAALTKARNKKAFEDSQRNTQQEQTSNKTENNEIEQAAGQAENKIEEIQNKSPDTGKKPRPRD